MRCLALLAIALLLLAPPGGGEIDPYISHPGNIPDFHNFTTPQLEPGDNGAFRLAVTNRYAEAMEEVVIEAAIYMRADIETSQEIGKMQDDEPLPYIKQGCWSLAESEPRCEATTNFQTVRFVPGTLAPNATLLLSFVIHSDEDTTEGTYFVSFALDFTYNSTPRVMLSRGHFTQRQWDNATTNVPAGSPGNINLTALGVDGIIPDSSFGVKKPIPRWPLYGLIFLTIFFAGLAIIFYLEDEGTYPGLNLWLQKQRGKFNQFRLRFKYRKRGP